jgi:hypothetical protein
MAGLTENGLVIRTQPELQALIEEKVASAVPGVDLSNGPEQQIIGVLSEELAIAWETLQAINGSFDPDGAQGVLLDRIMALTGAKRRVATRSHVFATVTLGAGITLPALSVAAVANAPDSQFRTLTDVTNATGSPADVTVELESVLTGPVAAPAGTLTVIVTSVSGWSAITNAADADLGRVVAQDPEARVTRIVELAGSGQDSYESIRAQVAKVTGVIECEVYGNETLTTDADGRPGKSVEAVVWDGTVPAADDDAIAQAIFDKKPAGIIPYGVGDSGDATTRTLTTVSIDFTRAAALRVYCSGTYVLAAGTTGTGWKDQVKAAIVARAAAWTVGEKNYASQLVQAVLDSVPAVVAAPTLTIGTSPSPIGTETDPTYAQITRIATADVTVTEA